MGHPGRTTQLQAPTGRRGPQLMRVLLGGEKFSVGKLSGNDAGLVWSGIMSSRIPHSPLVGFCCAA
jgi:hypothetical protein